MIEGAGLKVRLAGEVVVDDVTVQLTPGRILGIIGPPAAGKTVLTKALAGLVPLEAGEVRAAGATIDFSAPAAVSAWQRRIGMAFQNDALFDALCVFDNVAFPLRRRSVEESTVETRVLQRLRDVQLEGARDELPSEISGGMRKRVGIARATVIDPEIGIFDSPVAGLDPLTGAHILSLIVELTQSLRMATLIVSNDLAVLMPICHRVVMLNAGRAVYDGEPDGLLRSERPEVVQFATGSDEGPL